MAYERKELLKEILQFFYESNKNYVNITKTIMIDKDMKEDDMLQQQFPNSQLLFCHFHVLKIFERFYINYLCISDLMLFNFYVIFIFKNYKMFKFAGLFTKHDDINKR